MTQVITLANKLATDIRSSNRFVKYISAFDMYFRVEIQSLFHVVDDDIQIEESSLVESTSSDSSQEDEGGGGIDIPIVVITKGGPGGGGNEGTTGVTEGYAGWWRIHSFIRYIAKISAMIKCIEFDGIRCYCNCILENMDKIPYLKYICENMDKIPYWKCIIIFCLYRFYIYLNNKYRFDILWSVPSWRMLSGYQNNYGGALPEWARPPKIEWYKPCLSGKMVYGYNFLRNKMRSLGLKCIHRLTLTSDFLHLANAGMGLKLWQDKLLQNVLLKVTTMAYDSKSKKYVYGFYKILVYLGLGVVVWYTFIPGDLMYPPVAYQYQFQDITPFRNPASVVEGYNRVTYLITKDIIQNVITTYNERPFNQILSLESVDMRSDLERGDAASVGTGILIAILLATKVLVPPVTGSVIDCQL